MSTAARRHVRAILLLLLLGCGGDPTGPSGGSLSVTIQGLPSGSAAAVSISGPNGYGQTLTGSQMLTGLAPGVYTVTASDVTVGAAPYQASPASQTVAVVRNGSPGSAFITYSTPMGSLAIAINGAGTNNSALVTVTGPGGYNQSVTNSKTLAGLTPGDYTIAAQNVTASCGAIPYTASPTSQTATVVASATTNASVTYTAPSGGQVNLCIDGMYLTQSAQNYAGTVPLVQNRNGLLRVFVVADQANTPASAVQVQLRLYPPVGLPSTVTLLPPVGMVSVPTAPDESALGNSWNYPLPGGTILSGFRMEAEVDPANAISESIESDNGFAPPAPVVRTMPTLNVTFVPIVQPGNQTGNITDANKDLFLDVTRRMHPIDQVNALIRSTPITTTTVLQSDGTGWQSVLDQVDVIAVADGARYYYGVAKVSYTSGVAGVAYVSTPLQPMRAALGWDHSTNNSRSIVAAHELGHNWGRSHAPCGGPSLLDPNYPEPDGRTGGYGYDISSGQIEPPTSSDIMGYCDPKWISNYTYSAVMDYLTTSPMVAGSPSASRAVQPCLLVWGYIQDGQLTLHPAFQINTRPALPGRSGPYTIEARADDGSSLFAHSFSPAEVADLPGSHQSFAFAIPLAPAQAARLTSLRLRGHGHEAVLSAARASAAAQSSAGPTLRRAAAGKVALRWDHRVYPMVMVRDAETGETMSLADGGSVELPTSKKAVDLVLSDGVRSVLKRVPVSP
jgi:hypothetical protein